MRRLFLLSLLLALSIKNGFTQEIKTPVLYAIGNNQTLKYKLMYSESHFYMLIGYIHGNENLGRVGDKFVFETGGDKHTFTVSESEKANMTSDGYYPFIADLSDLYAFKKKGLVRAYVIRDKKSYDFEITRYIKSQSGKDAKFVINQGIEAQRKAEMDMNYAKQKEEYGKIVYPTWR